MCLLQPILGLLQRVVGLLHSILALGLEAVGAQQTLNSPNNMKYLFIITLQLEADTYLNLFQGNIAIL